MPIRDLKFLALVLLLASGSAAVQSWSKGDAFLPGDSLYYAYATESLVSDGDFNLTNQLMPGGERSELKRHEGFFAVSPDDVVVPKHSTLLPILSIPFVLLFGTTGFLVLNVLQAACAVFLVALLGGNSLAARAIAVLLFLTSSWWTYCFNYSPDLLATALIAGAYAAAQRRRWFLCGLLAGLTVWSKVYAALFLLPLAIVILPAGGRATLETMAGSLPGILLLLIINYTLYGGPFITGYDRDARVAETGFIYTEHYSRFNQPFLPGLWKVLFDSDAGMIRTAPLWFLWPAGFYYAWRDQVPYSRYFALALAFGAMFNVLFFATYDEWNASTGGNRFLFPAVALGGAMLVPLALRFAKPPHRGY